MTDLLLYSFQIQDPLTGKWRRARWKASLAEIEKNGWKADGPPEVRTAHGDTSGFMRTVGADRRPHAPLANVAVPDPSAGERELARAFLRRYVTYCARRGRATQALNASALWHVLGARERK